MTRRGDEPGDDDRADGNLLKKKTALLRPGVPPEQGPLLGSRRKAPQKQASALPIVLCAREPVLERAGQYWVLAGQ